MTIFKSMDNLLPLFSSLEKLYNKLAQLEIEELKDEQGYNSCIESIQLIISLIDKKRIAIDYNDFIRYKEYLIKKNNISTFDLSNLDEYILSNGNYPIRLINQAYYLSKNASLTLDKIFDDSKDDEDLVASINAMNTLILTSIVSDAFDELLLRTLFEYILEEINKTTSLPVKNQLIQIKYKLLFLYPELENAFIYKRMKKNTSFSKWSKYLINTLKKLEADYESFKEIYIDYLYDCVIKLTESISNLDDEFFDNEQNRIIVLIRVILIKAFMSVNIDLNTAKKLEQSKDELLNKTKSKEVKKYLLQSFDLSKKLNIPKMVDL